MKKFDKIKKWVRDHKDTIITVCITTASGVVLGYLNAKMSEKIRGEAFTDGYLTGCKVITGGMNPNKTLAMTGYEYAGYGEFHDCDGECADKMIARAQELGLCNDDLGRNVKRVKYVNFMEIE